MRNFFTKTGSALWMAVFFSFSAFGQVEIEWDRTYGGDRYEELHSVAAAPDGGFLLGGTSNSSLSGDITDTPHDGQNYWVVKTDAAGNKEWDKIFGGDSHDILAAVLPAPDGGFLLGGSSMSGASGDKSEESRSVGDIRGDHDIWIIKIDAAGNKVWDKTIGGNSSDQLITMLPTDDGGFLLGGESFSSASGEKTADAIGYEDIWIVKIDAAGNIEWDRAFGTGSSDMLRDIAPSGDGGFLLGGGQLHPSCDPDVYGFYYWDYWAIRIDASGNKLWDYTYGSCEHDFLYEVALADDGGFLLAGASSAEASRDKTEGPKREASPDYWTVKIDASGAKLWDKVYGGTGNDRVEAVLTTDDGGFMLGGYSTSDASGDKTEDTPGSDAFWILRTDASGNKLWDKTIGGDSYDRLMSITATGNGGYLLGGYSASGISGDKTEAPRGEGYSDYWIVKVRVEEEREPETPEPTIGFITGSGWFLSPAGAYEPDHFVQERAHFNFLARQLEEKETVKGFFSFRLPDARISFMSEEIEWISVEEDRAFIKGTGRLDRGDGYHFLLSVQERGRGASAPNDKLRIMIWDRQQTIIYDNQMGDPMYAGAEMEIQRGIIQIHELKRTTSSAFARVSEFPAGPMPTEGFRVYPTVLNDVGLWLEFPEVSDRQELTLRIFDIQGRQMTSLPLSIEKGSSRQFWQTNHQHWPKGIYFLRLSNGREEYHQKLMK